MSLPIHPLADLFPLIEGTEFDELVASIREHGLYEPITLLAGTILDGRNRYRACKAADVAPRFEEFDGDDPYAFVAAKNISRRHLTPSQRGLIGARMATLKLGNVKAQNSGVGIPTPSAQQVANMLGINRDTVMDAKVVLNEGTEDEIKSVETGKAAVSTLANNIRARDPDKDRSVRTNLNNIGKNQQRINNVQMNAQIWNQLREAITLLTSLPLPADVVPIARGFDKRANNFLDARLPTAIDWLKGFSNEWSNRNGSADEEEQASGDHADAGSSDRAA